MLIDTHVHVGQFFNFYFAPSDIHNLMEQLHISYYAVSSTSMCEENYEKVLNELEKLIEIDGEKVLPIMWVTPDGFKGNIAWFLESKIRWKMIKIHPFLDSDVWQKSPELFIEVTEIAREFGLPLLIHTGNEECCQCNAFERIIATNQDINFILAHGRPLKQAIRLAQTYNNVFVDSAFMPIGDMTIFLDKELDSKLLWGSDMCIPKYFYPDQDLEQYYLNKLDGFRKKCSSIQFENVTVRNAINLFHLNA